MVNYSTDDLRAQVKKTYQEIELNKAVQKALQFIKEDHENTIGEQIELTEIPAPPFKERTRANDFMQRLEALNLKDVQMDEEGNVFGTRPGNGIGPTIFISAHLDTVFPEGTDTTVTEKNGVLYAPGISDDTRGLAELLSIIRAINDANIQHTGDIIFGGTVGEEGAGDLRGVKSFFNENTDIDGFISIDGPKDNNIVYLGTGSYRYQVTYKGKGGHSYGAFGIPSPIHALGRAIAKIADLKTKTDPKTTFTVGEIEGGTSVNAIASQASMKVDLRSSDREELHKLENCFLTIVEDANVEENTRWASNQLSVHTKRFGNRPSATQSQEDMIVQSAWASIETLGEKPALAYPGSTDANYPMSLGIPSVALGRGGEGGGTHTLDEWFDPHQAYLGVQKNLLTLVGVIGVDTIEPLLGKKEGTSKT